MTAFNPIPPRRAADLVRRAGIDEPHRVLADFSSAGIVKTYARSIVAGAHTTGRSQQRDATIPNDLWGHIIDAEKIEDVFARGSVELFGPGTTFGQPHVAITGIRFNEGGVLKLVEMHGVVVEPGEAQAKPKRATKASAAKPVSPEPGATAEAEEAAVDDAERGSTAPSAPPSPGPTISPDAELITVEKAAVMMGCGRTKAWGMVTSGELVSVRNGKRMTRVTVASVRKWIEQHKRG